MFFTHKIESFFRSLKLKEVYMFSYETYGEVRERIPYFIDEVYNRKRLHSFVCKFQLFRKLPPALRTITNIAKRLWIETAKEICKKIPEPRYKPVYYKVSLNS